MGSFDVVSLLSGFERWRLEPASAGAGAVGFYGLDVYSLWDSLRVVMSWLTVNAPAALAGALQEWRCFLPYGEDPHRYAGGTPSGPGVVGAGRGRATCAGTTAYRGQSDEDAFDAVQNAEVAAGGERYDRILMRGDRDSWNIRDHHMTDTIERIAQHHGLRSRGLVWQHNTHVGDARGNDMARQGMVNVGQLPPERHGA